MNQQIDFKNKSTMELKAVVYDISVIMRQYDLLLKTLNEEINRRVKEEEAAIKNPE